MPERCSLDFLVPLLCGGMPLGRSASSAYNLSFPNGGCQIMEWLGSIF